MCVYDDVTCVYDDVTCAYDVRVFGKTHRRTEDDVTYGIR